jgi:hypothetical protein
MHGLMFWEAGSMTVRDEVFDPGLITGSCVSIVFFFFLLNLL